MSETRLLQVTHRLAHVLSKIERTAASQQGISIAQLRILTFLYNAEADNLVRITDVADDQGVALSTMTRNLGVLGRNGWVVRTPGSVDKRTVYVTLTDAGRRIARIVKESIDGAYSKAFKAFHPTDRVERAAALGRVTTALEKVVRESEDDSEHGDADSARA